jgi:hypothetical protein
MIVDMSIHQTIESVIDDLNFRMNRLKLAHPPSSIRHNIPLKIKDN